ncbi:hypothetical protein [Rathayibacter sp. SD072]|uniref:hypothetical protein n=1 Tax=Rathayibacter sp. SD072 TaxID=2781731 RepID=UPI001A96C1A3|nr:hypothetical protein [Rathayibacter sp. SD072]MBO0982319.1 hypothetical protein [Rathayibacter sp. SD072]
MVTKCDPNHPHHPNGYFGFAVEAYRDNGCEAPWLLTWRDGAVMTNLETGRYRYYSELNAGKMRGRGGRRH